MALQERSPMRRNLLKAAALTVGGAFAGKAEGQVFAAPVQTVDTTRRFEAIPIPDMQWAADTFGGKDPSGWAADAKNWRRAHDKDGNDIANSAHLETNPDGTVSMLHFPTGFIYDGYTDGRSNNKLGTTGGEGVRANPQVALGQELPNGEPMCFETRGGSIFQGGLADARGLFVTVSNNEAVRQPGVCITAIGFSPKAA